MTEIALERTQEARAHVTLPPPVLARTQRHVFRGRAAEEHLGAVAVLHPVVEAVELRQGLEDPLRAALGVAEVQVRMALEHAREHQVPERAVRPPGDLEHEHRGGRRWVHAEVGSAAAAVVVDRHLVGLAGRPDRLVLGRVQAAGSPNRAVRPGARCRPAGCARPPTRSRPPSPRRRRDRSARTRHGARAPGTRSRRANGCGPAGPPSGARRRRPTGGASSWLRAIGANGGWVFGKITSATQPSASCSRRRRSLFQLRSASASGSPSTPTDFFMPRPFIISRIIREPSSIDAAHTSKSSWYFDSRYGWYPRISAPACASAEIRM